MTETRLSIHGARILRGQIWAVRIARQMVEGQDTFEWFEKNTDIIKRDKSGCSATMEIQDGLCFLKYYRARSPLKKLRFALGRGRPLRQHDMGVILRGKGVIVPRPRGCLRIPGGLMAITKAVAGAQQLDDLWRVGVSEEEGNLLMELAADQLAHLHRAEFAHGDYKWSNLMWQGERMYLVDLDSVKHVRLRHKKQGRDVARFIVNAEELRVTQAHLDRFIEIYVAGMGEDISAITKRVQPWLRKLRRRHARGKVESDIPQPLF